MKSVQELMEEMDRNGWELAATVARYKESLLFIKERKPRTAQEKRDFEAVEGVLKALSRWEDSAAEFMIASGKTVDQRPHLELIVNK